MAFDAIFLKHLVKEIEPQIVGKKVEKIFQPTKQELAFQFRNFSETVKLLISTNASCARMHIVKEFPQNPKTPPMFCMLMRKYLNSAILESIEIPDLERIIYMKFAAYNELGDKNNLVLVIELMGKYSNIILLNQENVIIDAIKRVDSSISSKRLVLPKLEYTLPPAQNKINLEKHDPEDVINKMQNSCQNKGVPQALLSSIKGISTIVAEELACRANLTKKIVNNSLNKVEISKLLLELENLQDTIKNCKGQAFIVKDETGKFLDFSFIELHNIGKNTKFDLMSSFSETVELFYKDKAEQDRINSKTQNLRNFINLKNERIKRKIKLQQIELEKSVDREKFKIYADILQSNLYKIKKGSKGINLENFYNNMEEVYIELNPMYSPTQNVQNYYKKYKKAANAEKHLKLELDKGQKEVDYLESILYCLSRSATEEELSEIKKELHKEGYLKKLENPSKKRKKEKKLPPIVNKSSSGFDILTGRNNHQNDNLSLKKAKPDDIWFHVKNIPGSHTVLVVNNDINGAKPTDQDILDAANVAVFYSAAKGATKIDVDYTKIKNVKKPHGAKPGKVIYFDYKTIKAGGRSY